MYSENDYRNYLSHHGILGMRWGVRRYQNKDGSLTPAGKKRAKSLDDEKSKRFDRTDWSALGVIKARKDYKNAQTHNESNKVREKFEKAIRDLQERHMQEGSEIDWGSKKGRALEDRQYNEEIELRAKATRALLTAKLMDGGYSKQSAESGADWMIKNGFNLSISDGTWGVHKSPTNAGKKRYSSTDSTKDAKHESRPNVASQSINQHHISSSQANQLMQQHIAMNNLNQMAMQEATRASVNASLQTMSLAATGGTNPYMFGMM